MKLLALSLFLAAPVLAQTSVATGGTTVIPAPAQGTGSITPSTCLGSQLSNGIKSDGTVNCVPAPTATVPPASTSTMGAVTLKPGASPIQTQLGSTSDAMTAIANQTSPGSGDGIANALASTGCKTIGCFIEVGVAYPFDAERTGTPYPALTGTGQAIRDLRGGADRMVCNDPGLAMNFNGDGQFCVSRDVRVHYSLNQLQGYGAMFLNVTDTSPGHNWGPGGGPSSNWTVGGGIVMTLMMQRAGIKNGINLDLACVGSGDCNNYWYIHDYGTYRTKADEAVQGLAGKIDSPISHYVGTLSSISGDTIITSKTGGNYTDLGSQQRVVDTTARMSTGYVTAQASMTDAAGNSLYKVFTISSPLTTSAVSTWWGTQTTAITTVPEIDSTGINPVTTSATFQVSTVGGASVPTAGQWITISAPKMERVQITSVSSLGGGNYSITAKLRHSHPQTGQLIFQNAWGRAGFEFTANSSSGLRYDNDMIGAISTTQVVVVQMQQGVLNLFNFGKVDLNRLTVDCGMSNTGGVVTLSFCSGGLQYDLRYRNYPTLTISGATNAAFNGACLNSRNPTFGFPFTVQCDQAASSGQTSAGSSSSYVSVGATGYGNTAYNIYPLAEVIDIQAYGGAGTVPGVNGTLRLEGAPPTAFAVNDTIEMDHDYAGKHSLVEWSDSNPNPYLSTQSKGSIITFDGVGTGLPGNALYTAQNAQALTEFQGFGGDNPAPDAFSDIGTGVFRNILNSAYAPAPGGSVINVGLPAAGLVSDPTYSYAALNLGGLAQTDTCKYTPATNTLDCSGVKNFKFGAPTVSSLNGSPLASSGSIVQLTNPLPSLTQEFWMTDCTTTCPDHSGAGNTGTLGTGAYAPTITPLGAAFNATGTALQANYIDTRLKSFLTTAETWCPPTLVQTTGTSTGGFPSQVYAEMMGPISSSSGILLSMTPNGITGQLSFQPSIYALDGSGWQTEAATPFGGSCHVFTQVYAATDHFYVDGVETPYIAQASVAAKIPTTDGSTYSIGQGGPTNNGNGMRGTIAHWSMSSVAATPAQVAAYSSYSLALVGGRPGFLTSSPAPSLSASPQLLAVGDSLIATYNNSTSTQWPSLLTLDTAYTVTDWGVGGLTATDLNNTAEGRFLPKVVPGGTVIVNWAGTNGLYLGRTAAQEYASLAALVKKEQKAGAQAFVIPMISRTGFDSGKDALNPLIYGGMPGLGATIIDIAEIPGLGADGAYSSTACFNADQVHLSPTGSGTCYASLGGYSVVPLIVSKIVNFTNSQYTAGNPHVYTASATLASADANVKIGTLTTAATLTVQDCMGFNGIGPRFANPQSAYAVTLSAASGQTINGTNTYNLPANGSVHLTGVNSGVTTGGCSWVTY